MLTFKTVASRLVADLGDPTRENESSAEWGTDGVLPNALVRDTPDGVTLELCYDAGERTGYLKLLIAASAPDLAGMLLRGEPTSGESVSLELVAEVAKRAMGLARMSPGVVMSGLVDVGGINYEQAGNTATWKSAGSVTLRREADETATVTLRGEHGETTHTIAETTSTPAVIGCRNEYAARVQSGACTLAVALEAAKAVLDGES